MQTPTPLIARASWPLQRGQSTVEFVVLALVMVPLLLIVPLLGKYMDIAQTTTVASRYVAFEANVRHSSSSAGWKTDAELAQEVRRRFFSNSDAPIKTNDTAGDFNAHRNTLWFDHKGNPILPTFASDVSVTTTKESMTQPFGTVFAGSLDLSYANLYTGQVTVNLANVPGLAPFDALGLSIGRSTTLLADPWAASGPAMVRAKIQSDPYAFPYKSSLPPGIYYSSMLLIPFTYALESNSPNIGGVAPDIVPIDRLK